MSPLTPPRIPRRRPGNQERGVTTLEMALVLPVFFMMLFGIIELANILRIQFQLNNAVSEAARTATLVETTTSTAKSSVENLLSAITQNNPKAQAPEFNLSPSPTATCKETPCDPFTVQASYTYYAINPLMEPFFDGLQLSASAKRISEPW
ncbi:MAG: TadE/TadG family type IV pilus assembly protein [Solidesulfovibrio sp. DCME]|uniref:TadE/TadG family type IV pilus assembly protein n=1 Tax=Solidesulfovibrio sp. DCME TaxID=3447380 RepID=UPI003D09BBD6